MNPVLQLIDARPAGRYGWFDITCDALAPDIRRGDKVIVDLFTDQSGVDGLYMIAIGGDPYPRRLQFDFHGGLTVIHGDGRRESVPKDRVPELMVIGRIVAVFHPC